MARLTVVGVSCFLLSLLLTVPAAGQGGVTSTISCVVSDNTGAVVPGASVVVVHRATGVTQESATNNDGSFAFPSMQPGNYTVTIALTGFRTVVINNVVVTSGAPAA